MDFYVLQELMIKNNNLLIVNVQGRLWHTPTIRLSLRGYHRIEIHNFTFNRIEGYGLI